MIVSSPLQYQKIQKGGKKKKRRKGETQKKNDSFNSISIPPARESKGRGRGKLDRCGGNSSHIIPKSKKGKRHRFLGKRGKREKKRGVIKRILKSRTLGGKKKKGGIDGRPYFNDEGGRLRGREKKIRYPQRQRLQRKKGRRNVSREEKERGKKKGMKAW